MRSAFPLFGSSSFNYQAKARELHRLRIELERERYGHSVIERQNEWIKWAISLGMPRAIYRFFI